MVNQVKSVSGNDFGKLPKVGVKIMKKMIPVLAILSLSCSGYEIEKR
ncbi:hypothetical protein V7127_22545 [Bacillus sp. JJ1773]